MACSLVNLGSCLPQMFFEFVLGIINAPIQPFLQLTLHLLSEPINLHLFMHFWAIIVYMLSMFYALLLVSAGFSMMLAGPDVEKREKSKEWLKNVVIMIILVQASFFIYQLILDLAAAMTSATLTLVDGNFFLITASSISELGLAISLSFAYLATILITSTIFVIRYVIVAIGVVFFPIAIFLYFLPPLKAYGLLIMNFLGTALFITFFDAILLIGFSQLVNVGLFSSLKVILLIAAFLVIDSITLFLVIFAIVRAALTVYSDIKRIGRKL